MILRIGDKQSAVESRSDSRRLVSIITPTYNHERFIGACIESVLSQTYVHWEQIIIDDGATDNTEGIAKRYHDPRVRYCRQENQGLDNLAITYNRAFYASRGSPIPIQKGDDLWPPNKLATMVDAFADSSVVLGYGVMGEIDVACNVSRRSAAIARKYRRLARSVLFTDPVLAAM